MKASLDRLEAFFELRYRITDATDEEICDLFHLDPESTGIPDAAQVCPLELTLLLEAFHEFHQDLRKVHWFQRVNTEAVERILAKLGRRGQAADPSYRKIRTRWEALRTGWDKDLSRHLQRYDSLIADASGGLRDPQRTTGKSLYLARVLDFGSRPYADEILQAVQSGNSRFLIEAFGVETFRFDVSPDTVEELASDVLRYSVMLRPALAEALLASPGSFVIDNHALKWAILAIGRRQKMDSSPETTPHRRHHAPAGFQPLQRILKSCTQDQLSKAVVLEDELDRRPVHYAAMYGVTDYADFGIDIFLEKFSDEPGDPDPELLEMEDTEGLTPIDLAVMANHSKTLAEMAQILGDGDYDPPFAAKDFARHLLPIALMNETENEDSHVWGHVASLEAIVTSEKAALPAAFQARNNGVVSVLLNWLASEEGSEEGDSEVAENEESDFDVADRRGWTHLFYACALGQYDIVKSLLELGCSQTRTDELGWTAKEYAVLHGHLAVAGLLEPSDPRDMTDGPARVPEKKIVHPKLYCAEGERIIIASLGSERVNESVTEVNLSYCSSVYTPSTYNGMSYALEISATGTTAQPRVVRLPILDDQINAPFVFPIPATVEPQLVFKVFRQGAGTDSQGIMVGSGTALLEGNTRQFGARRQSLIREQSIPILDKDTMAAVGTVTFTFMVANHFPHLQTPRNVDVARKAADPPSLIGHRGLGMNLKMNQYLQIGENTVQSCLSAAKLGASFVEFDYQVTKDHEAVIFHDFSLSQSGTDVPVHDVTLDQFMYTGNIQSPHGNPLSVLGPVHSRDEPGGKRKRSRSIGGQFEAGAIQLRDRMKHTVDFKKRGFEPNTRGDFIQDSLATLKELLIQVPDDIGFDIEISPSPLNLSNAAQ